MMIVGINNVKIGMENKKAKVSFTIVTLAIIIAQRQRMDDVEQKQNVS
jgi:hypothetical protein